MKILGRILIILFVTTILTGAVYIMVTATNQTGSSATSNTLSAFSGQGPQTSGQLPGGGTGRPEGREGASSFGQSVLSILQNFATIAVVTVVIALIKKVMSHRVEFDTFDVT